MRSTTVAARFVPFCHVLSELSRRVREYAYGGRCVAFIHSESQCMAVCVTKPHIATNGAHDPIEKNPEPYRTIRIILHFYYESAICGGVRMPTGMDPLPYLTKILPHHYVTMTYWPNLTNNIAIPYVCLYHVHVSAVHSCPNELCDIHCDTHATIKVTVQSEHEKYQSYGDTYDTNPLRIIGTTSRTFQYRPYKMYCYGAWTIRKTALWV